MSARCECGCEFDVGTLGGGVQFRAPRTCPGCGRPPRIVMAAKAHTELRESSSLRAETRATYEISPLGRRSEVVAGTDSPATVRTGQVLGRPSTTDEESVYGPWLAQAYNRLNGTDYVWDGEVVEPADGFLVSPAERIPVQLTHLDIDQIESLGAPSGIGQLHVADLPDLVVRAVNRKLKRYGRGLPGILGLICSSPIYVLRDGVYPSFPNVEGLHAALEGKGFEQIWIVPAEVAVSGSRFPVRVFPGPSGG